MDRALILARKGEAQASPNPMVGAVLVKNGRVIGRGYHRYAKLDHAEIVALRAAGKAARGATLYVNLEPCCHRGRTGPCTSSIIAAGIRRVVVAMKDPNPAVAGRGLAQLRRAGIEVALGPCEREAHRLNEAFAKWISRRRPFVTLKTAMTEDGKIAWPPALRRKYGRWITSPESRAEVQRMRHAHDAVLTGVGTVLADDPQLTDRVKRSRRRGLLRVVLDSRLRLPLDSSLVRSAKKDVLVFTAARVDSPRATRLQRAGVQLVRVPGLRGKPDLNAVFRELGRRNILNVMIEAGTQVNSAALLAGVVDKLVVFGARRRAGRGGKPWASKPAVACLGKLYGLQVRGVGPDFCYEGYLRDVYRNR
jgi:diaminohydroxyphosphoribosylaminopyrimidine deaminase/5-amino-6-(5-phosphoribosylamino)uracil reductase